VGDALHVRAGGAQVVDGGPHLAGAEVEPAAQVVEVHRAAAQLREHRGLVGGGADASHAAHIGLTRGRLER